MPKPKSSSIVGAKAMVVKKESPSAGRNRSTTKPQEAITLAVGSSDTNSQETIILQVGSSEWDISSCKERVLESLSSGEKKAVKVKALQIYIKPEDGKIYYVANGDQTGSIDL